jgi:hypothetical protein
MRRTLRLPLRLSLYGVRVRRGAGQHTSGPLLVEMVLKTLHIGRSLRGYRQSRTVRQCDHVWSCDLCSRLLLTLTCRSADRVRDLPGHRDLSGGVRLPTIAVRALLLLQLLLSSHLQRLSNHLRLLHRYLLSSTWGRRLMASRADRSGSSKSRRGRRSVRLRLWRLRRSSLLLLLLLMLLMLLLILLILLLVLVLRLTLLLLSLSLNLNLSLSLLLCLLLLLLLLHLSLMHTLLLYELLLSLFGQTRSHARLFVLGKDALVLQLAQLLWRRNRHTSLRQETAMTLVYVDNLLPVDSLADCEERRNSVLVAIKHPGHPLKLTVVLSVDLSPLL